MGIKFKNLSYEQQRSIYGLVDDTLRQSMLERRRYARVDARLQVNFVYAEGFIELRTEDLSLGGLFIATDHLVPVGEKVQLTLNVQADQPPVQAKGEVVRVVEEAAPGLPAGLGVKFLDLEEPAVSIIRGFLARRVAGEIEGGDLERRRHPRVERLIKLSFRTGDLSGTVLARDISTGGVFIQTHEPPPVGSEIRVTLMHPVKQDGLELSGRVVRVVEADLNNPHQVPGIGVEFKEVVDEDSRRMLQEFLKDLTLLECQPDDQES